jgi:hypothetical protein
MLDFLQRNANDIKHGVIVLVVLGIVATFMIFSSLGIQKVDNSDKQNPHNIPKDKELDWNTPDPAA